MLANSEGVRDEEGGDAYRGLQGNITSVGGYVQLGKIPVWSGTVWGWDDQGRRQCIADLEWRDVGGVGLSLQVINENDQFDCDNVDCVFSEGNEVRLRVVTLLFVTYTRITMAFCEGRAKRLWGLGLGLGWQGSIWKVRNTRNWQ